MKIFIIRYFIIMNWRIGFIIFQFHEPAFSILKDIFDKGKFQIIQFGWDIQRPYMFVNSVIGGMLLSLASHGADHMMVQRVLSTRNLSAARKAMIGSGIFVFFQFVIFSSPAPRKTAG